MDFTESRSQKKVMALSEKYGLAVEPDAKNRGHNCRYAAEDRDS